MTYAKWSTTHVIAQTAPVSALVTLAGHGHMNVKH